MNAPVPRANVTLDDKFNVQSGWIYLTGTQALTRLPIQQAIRDKAAGLNTGGFISGYRGSPLGRYDVELWAQKKLLERHNIHFMPGINEDLAATAVWGAQYVGQIPGAKVDGVFSIWYGKGPGTDRSTDAFRHLGVAGANKYGGVLAIAGDDHGIKSSTVYNFSDPIFIATGMPVLYPSNTQELLELGLHGIALSRFSGCAVGFKVHNDIVEGGGSVSFGAPQLLAMAGWSSLPCLWSLRQPTVVLMGSDYPLVLPVNGRILASLIPNAELRMIDDGQLFMVTRPAEVAAVMEEFLAKESK
jgi:indolepyruvate ferredoxin oxidoreductase